MEDKKLIQALIDKWRLDANTMRGYGAEQFASAVERCIKELATAVETGKLEAITYAEAAEESGFSYSAIQKMVTKGIIPNAGERGRPRVRRGDLPRKAPASQGIADIILMTKAA